METAMIQATEFEAPQTTDPREGKLKDIIEKGKASLHKTLEEIQHEFAIREDMAVRPTAIDFLVQGHKIQPVIRDEAYDLTDHSQGQMLTRAGIPAQFAQKLMDLEENELLSRNLKRLTERMEEGGILLRRVGTTIKGWLSPAYKRMDAAPIMESFLESEAPRSKLWGIRAEASECPGVYLTAGNDLLYQKGFLQFASNISCSGEALPGRQIPVRSRYDSKDPRQELIPFRIENIPGLAQASSDPDGVL